MVSREAANTESNEASMLTITPSGQVKKNEQVQKSNFN
jgi:hypothetical protein